MHMIMMHEYIMLSLSLYVYVCPMMPESTMQVAFSLHMICFSVQVSSKNKMQRGLDGKGLIRCKGAYMQVLVSSTFRGTLNL